jgi:thiol-disulfide isomerase/thioredoxin
MNLKKKLFFYICLSLVPINSQERVIENEYKPKTNISDIPIYTLDNDRFTLYEEMGKLEEGKFLLLNFTSSYCVPCKFEIPELVRLKDNFQNIVLWFVFVGDDSPSIQKKMKDLNMTGNYKVLKDPLKTSLKRLGVSAVPMTYLIKWDKKILVTSLGYTPEKFTIFKSQVIEVVK